MPREKEFQIRPRRGPAFGIFDRAGPSVGFSLGRLLADEGKSL